MEWSLGMRRDGEQPDDDGDRTQDDPLPAPSGEGVGVPVARPRSWRTSGACITRLLRSASTATGRLARD